jgi:NADP-dependent aldehyde dehydrogenase
LFDLASKRPEPIPVFAEMSSVNPVFVLSKMEGEEMDQFAEGLTGSANLGVGQFCTNPGIVFHPAGEWGKKFAEVYAEKMSVTKPCPMLHQGIKDAYETGLNGLVSCNGIDVVYRSTTNENDAGSAAGPAVLRTTATSFLADKSMMEEVFGPSTLLVEYDSIDELFEVCRILEGQLTISIFGDSSVLNEQESLVSEFEIKAGRLLFNQFPTGVEVCPSVVHGGPYPATTDARSTSVGTGAILRFARPVCYQGFPNDFLPDELKDGNPLGLHRCEA